MENENSGQKLDLGILNVRTFYCNQSAKNDSNESSLTFRLFLGTIQNLQLDIWHPNEPILSNLIQITNQKFHNLLTSNYIVVNIVHSRSFIVFDVASPMELRAGIVMLTTL